VLSYLLGSVPFGFLTAYLVKGIDIRKFGSGNIGATNVVRIVGKPWGILVFVLDFLKGLAAPAIAAYLIQGQANLTIMLAAVLVVCGHNWTIFLKFKGGKGVATSLGALTALAFVFPQLWGALIVSLAVWVAVFRISKYVSLASLAASAVFFMYTLAARLPLEIRLLAALLFVLITLRHKSNILSLLKKKEHKF